MNRDDNAPIERAMSTMRPANGWADVEPDDDIIIFARYGTDDVGAYGYKAGQLTAATLLRINEEGMFYDAQVVALFRRSTGTLRRSVLRWEPVVTCSWAGCISEVYGESRPFRGGWLCRDHVAESRELEAEAADQCAS